MEDELQLKNCLSPGVKEAFAAVGPASCLGSTKATFQNKNKQQTNTIERDKSVCIAISGPGRAAQDLARLLLAFRPGWGPQSSGSAGTSRPGADSRPGGLTPGLGFLEQGESNAAAAQTPALAVNKASLQNELARETATDF